MSKRTKAKTRKRNPGAEFQPTAGFVMRRGSALTKRADRMARTTRYPIHECLVNADWQQSLLATIFVARKRTDNTYAASVFLVDLGCLGVKNAIAKTVLSASEYLELRSRIASGRTMSSASPERTVRILEQAVSYADQLGFQPHKDYWAARPILNGVEADETLSVVCGNNGKPFYVSGPHDNAPAIMSQLERKLGQDGFHYILGMS